MLVTRIAKTFNDLDWNYEIKLDGYRIILKIINNSIHHYYLRYIKYVANIYKICDINKA